MMEGWGASEECLEVCFMGVAVRGNYVWCLVIIILFMGFGIWRGKMVEDASKSSFEMAMQAKSGEGNNFNGQGRFPLCNNAELKLYCKWYWVQ